MEDRTVVKNQAPPPPSEVKVRTMRSDLASMAQSGGGIPRFESVTVDGLSMDKKYNAPSHASSAVVSTRPTESVTAMQSAPAQPAATSPVSATQPTQSPEPVQQPQPTATDTAASPKKDMYPIFIVGVVAVLAAGAVGYFAYITFFTGAPNSQNQQTNQTPVQTTALPSIATTTTTTTATSTMTTSQAQTTPLSAELSAAHVSFFKKPADQIITVDFTGVTAATYRKIMSGSLAAANAASSMIEINPKGSGGNNLSIQGLLSVAGASIITPQTLGSFTSDATFFVYRDKNGLWPGYVLLLNTGQTSSSVGTGVQQIESSTNIPNLFVIDPGTPSSDGFTGSVTAGVPVRILPFSGYSIPSYFTYGWHGNYLILSTSKNGFAAAVADL